ncbi:unnamed protein product [Chrysoparadoxa australica]
MKSLFLPLYATLCQALSPNVYPSGVRLQARRAELPSSRSFHGGSPCLGLRVSPRVGLGMVASDGSDMQAIETAVEVPTTQEAAKGEPSAMGHKLKVATLFFLWYLFNIGYNLCTKSTLNAISIPYTLAVAQLVAGLPYVFFLWLSGLRPAPKMSLSNIVTVAPVAVMHMFAHLAAVVSLGAGAVGFVQIVKACEPLFTALFNGLFFGDIMALPVYLTLIPVVGGVGLASLSELSFSWLAFGAAMVSNSCAGLRSVFGKATMGKSKGENMDAGNLYAVITILATIALTPLAFAMEGRQLSSLWAAAVNKGYSEARLARVISLSGLFFYLYNEVAFRALDLIHPLTHSLGNTLKRVVMIIVSVLVLKHRFTPRGVGGCVMAIGGVMAYSVAKHHYDSKDKEA